MYKAEGAELTLNFWL